MMTSRHGNAPYNGTRETIGDGKPLVTAGLPSQIVSNVQAERRVEFMVIYMLWHPNDVAAMSNGSISRRAIGSIGLE